MIVSGSESPAPYPMDKNPLAGLKKAMSVSEASTSASMASGTTAATTSNSEPVTASVMTGDVDDVAKMLMMNAAPAEKHLSNEISAPYEVPQYPIEQIETKMIR